MSILQLKIIYGIDHLYSKCSLNSFECLSFANCACVRLKLMCAVFSPLSSFPIPLGGAIFPRDLEKRLSWFFQCMCFLRKTQVFLICRHWVNSYATNPTSEQLCSVATLENSQILNSEIPLLPASQHSCIPNPDESAKGSDCNFINGLWAPLLSNALQELTPGSAG